MDILNTFSFKSNRQIKINLDGGDLSSDAGLLLVKEFAAKIGFIKLIKRKFKTNDTSVCFHKDDENLMQMVESQKSEEKLQLGWFSRIVNSLFSFVWFNDG